MKKQLLRMALAAAWMGSGAVWAQAPATPTAPAAPTVPAAPAAPVMPEAPAKRAAQTQGRVTAIDMTKKTLTVAGRRDPTGTTLTLAPDAKVLVSHPALLGDIKAGDIVAAYGAVTPGATTVTATRLVVMPTDTPTGKPGKRAGYRRTYVQGTVANTTPALTMTTPGGVTVTVTPEAGAPVTKMTTGSLSDIAVGANITARTTGAGASLTATEVRVLPAGGQRRAGRRVKKGTPTFPTTPTAPAAPTTPTPSSL